MNTPSPYVIPGLDLNTPIPKKSLSIEYIEYLVCSEYNVEPRQLHDTTRRREILEPRQITMFLSRKYTNLSLKTVGAYYRKDHATALNAQRVVNGWYETDKSFKERMLKIEDELKK